MPATPTPARDTAGQAAIAAGAVAAAVFAVALLVTLLARLPWWLPVLTALIAGLLGFAVSGLLLVVDNRRLVWHAEGLMRVDLDRDGVVGRPLMQAERQLVTLELKDGKRLRYVDLPLTEDEISQMARAVKRSGVFSRRAMPEGLMSTEVYQEVKDRLLAAGLLRERGAGPSAGVELTGSGRACIGRYTE